MNEIKADELAKPRYVRMQGHPPIPYEVARRFFYEFWPYNCPCTDEYLEKCYLSRGGFSAGEMDMYWPEWRQEVSLIKERDLKIEQLNQATSEYQSTILALSEAIKYATHSLKLNSEAQYETGYAASACFELQKVLDSSQPTIQSIKLRLRDEVIDECIATVESRKQFHGSQHFPTLLDVQYCLEEMKDSEAIQSLKKKAGE